MTATPHGEPEQCVRVDLARWPVRRRPSPPQGGTAQRPEQGVTERGPEQDGAHGVRDPEAQQPVADERSGPFPS